MKAECVGEKASGKVATGAGRCRKVCGSGPTTTAYNLNRTTPSLKPRSKQKPTSSSVVRQQVIKIARLPTVKPHARAEGRASIRI